MKRNQKEKQTRSRKSSFEKARRRTRFCEFMLLGAVLLFVLLGGCGGGSPSSSISGKKPPPAPARKTSEPSKAVEQAEPKKQEEIEYSYNAAGKPDPFRPFIRVSGGEFSKGAMLTPLQKYDISQLKLVAVIIAAKGNIALVEDSLGKGYFLKKGTRVGRNDGQVKRILKDRVIVEEVDEESSGQRKVSEISLILHRLEEGGES